MSGEVRLSEDEREALRVAQFYSFEDYIRAVERVVSAHQSNYEDLIEAGWKPAAVPVPSESGLAAAVEALADEWEANYDRWINVHDGPRVSIYHAHANRLRALLSERTATTGGGGS